MGGKVKVPLYGNPNRAAFINTDATVGATIGLDLRLPDGSVPSLDQLALLLASRAGGVQQGGSLGNASVTLWRLIREIPPNVQQVEALQGAGLVTRRSDGTWTVRELTVADPDRLVILDGDGDEDDPLLDTGPDVPLLSADQTFLGTNTFDITPVVPDGSWAYAKIADASALSVLGRATDTSGVLADIQAGSDHQILRRSGDTIGFGSINLASSDAVGTSRLGFANLAQVTGPAVLGVSSSGDGNLAAISASADDRLLRRTSGALTWGQLTAGMFPAEVVPDEALSSNVALYDGDVGQFASGTFDDARIAESNVTQHQAALSIGWSQLTDVPPIVLESRKIDTGTGLTGGGDLSQDRTIALDTTTQSALALATSAVQPGDLAAVATSGDFGDLSDVPAMVSSLASLSDPNADRIVFWDDSAGALAFLEIGTGLEISGTSLQLTSAAQNALTLAATALQPGDNISDLTNDTGYITGIGGFSIGDLADVNIGTPGSGEDGYALVWDNDEGEFVLAPVSGGGGTVTSVAVSVPTGFTVTGSPITSSGTIEIEYDTGYQGFTSAEAALIASAVQPGDLAAVAFSGDYDDLSNTPTIPPDVSAATFITASDETSTLSNSLQLVAGANITLDTSTPGQIVINSSASGGQVDEVIGTASQIDVDNSDPTKPVLSLHSNVLAALGLAGTAVQPGDLSDYARLSENNSFARAIWLQRPADYWASPAGSDGALFIGDLGYFGHQGAHRLALVWNGYRNTGGGWTSFGRNNFTSGAVFDFGNEGFFWRYSENPTGFFPPTIMSLSSGGELDVRGDLIVRGEATVSGTLSWGGGAAIESSDSIWQGGAPLLLTAGGTISPPALSVDVTHDWNPSGLAGANRILVSTDGAIRQIGGLAGGVDGRILILTAIGPTAFRIADNAPGSTAANRIRVPGVAYDVPNQASVMLLYDGTIQRWVVVGGW